YILQEIERRESRVLWEAIPKAFTFTVDEMSKIQKQVEETTKDMKGKDLAALLEFISGNKAAK
ncbi:MAG: hypothetical protein ACRD32_04395, partial [Nitrososphaerales archaeon]